MENYYKPSGLKQHNSYIPGDQNFRLGLTLKISVKVVLYGGSQGKCTFLPFPAARGCPHAIAHGPRQSSKAAVADLLLTSHHSDNGSSAFVLFKDSCDYTDPTLVIQSAD